MSDDQTLREWLREPAADAVALASLPPELLDRPVHELRFPSGAWRDEYADHFVTVRDGRVEFRTHDGDNWRTTELDLLEPMATLPTAPPPWQVPGLWFERSLVLAYGSTGSLKSFFSLDLANRMARGMDWADGPIAQAPAAYVVAEGQEGFGARQQAWVRHHDASPEAPLYRRLGAVDLLGRGLTRMPSAEAFLRTLLVAERGPDGLARPPALTVFDTLHRCMPGGTDASDANAEAVVGSCHRIMERTQGSVVLVHHTGWDRIRVRGSKVWMDAPDSILRLARQGDGALVVHVEKLRDEETDVRYVFEPVRVPLGTDALDRERSSLVLVPSSSQPDTRVEDAIREEPGIRNVAIARATGLSAATVTRRTKQLIDEGRVRKDEASGFWPVEEDLE